MSQDCSQACDRTCPGATGYCFDSTVGMCALGCGQGDNSFPTFDACQQACPPLTSESVGKAMFLFYIRTTVKP